MIPNLVKGKGITGALRYVMSEGYAEEKAEGIANDSPVSEHGAGRAHGSGTLSRA